MSEVVENSYGKARVRLVKVTRRDNYWHELKQLTVKVLLEGDFESSYSKADNSKVVPTDTCKNIVYIVARQHPIDSIESFGVELCEFFLSNYLQIRTVDLEIVEELWERMLVAIDNNNNNNNNNNNDNGNSDTNTRDDEQEQRQHQRQYQRHGHSFFKLPFVKLCHIRASKLVPPPSTKTTTATTPISTTTSTSTTMTMTTTIKEMTSTTSIPMIIDKLEIESGLKDLVILKTTQSGFEGYPKCQYTTLAETKDRLLGTNVQAIWRYNAEVVSNYYKRRQQRRHRQQQQQQHASQNVSTSTSNINSASINQKENIKDGLSDPDLDFEKIFQDVKQHIFDVFANHYSPSVQHTIYLIGDKILKGIPVIDRISLVFPNLHNWNVDYAKLNLPPSNEVFIPVDEPHGLIKATLSSRHDKSHYSRL
jgi:urate oxidase